MHEYGYIASGALVGFLVGMTGVGGGSLMTPLLILLCGVKPQTAVGSDLIYAAITKLFGTFLSRRFGRIRWSIILWLMAGSVPGVLSVLLWFHYLGSSPKEMAHIIRFSLGICLLIASPAIFLRPFLQKWVSSHHIEGALRIKILTVILGLVLGVMVTLSSVGAGAVGMAVLVMLYPTVPLRELVVADIAHAIPLTLLAGSGHWLAGDVDIKTVLLLLSGSLPGIWLGTISAGYAPEKILRWILGGLLFFIGIGMLH